MKEIFHPNKKRWVRPLAGFLLTFIILVTVFFYGYSAGRAGKFIALPKIEIKNQDMGKPQSVDFSLFWDAWNDLNSKSVVAPSATGMLYGSISGLLSSLNDPYTVFFSPEDNKRFKDDISGEFDGIGLEIIQKNNLPTVVAPLSETPAEKVGLKPGDIIISVDGTKTSDIGFNEMIDLIRGPKGTVAKLEVIRTGKDEPLEFSVTRDTIVVKSVQWEYRQENGKKIAYIKVRQFGDDTDGLFDAFVSDVRTTKPDGIVLDLRNDPGGYLETARNLISYFVDGGTVLIEKDRSGSSKEYKTTKKASLSDFNLAVLVNQGSASASEIFAGAIQDRKAGEVIGEKTFGKGSVQELIELKDGSSVKITVAKWYTPNGRTINGEGLAPDITIADDEATPADEQLDRALQFVTTGK